MFCCVFFYYLYFIYAFYVLFSVYHLLLPSTLECNLLCILIAIINCFFSFNILVRLIIEINSLFSVLFYNFFVIFTVSVSIFVRWVDCVSLSKKNYILHLNHCLLIVKCLKSIELLKNGKIEFAIALFQQKKWPLP